MSEKELLRALEALRLKEEENKLARYVPYPAQKRVCDSTAKTTAMIAGNQVGKTTCVSFIVACHLTGLYPDWWGGIRYTGPIDCWAAGVTANRVRDTIQEKLLGRLGRIGTGMIPKHLINAETLVKKSNVPLAYDRVEIKHVSGGMSSLQFFSYDQGMEKFMGSTIDLAWFDEEPPEDINNEVKMRLVVRNGLLLYSFTPLSGITPLFDSIERDESINKIYISQLEVPHLTEEVLKRMHAGMSEAEISARRDGRPKVGVGKVFQFAEEEYSIEPFEIPPHWRRIGALDIGLTHPTGALMGAIDDDSKTIYITNEYKVAGKTAIDHAAHLKHWGVKFLTDPTAFHRQIGTGQSTAAIYIAEGLDLIKANNDVWASIAEIRKLIGSGRMYIFTTCRELLTEIRTFRTKISDQTGKETIVKVNDDLVDPWRYLSMGIAEHAERPKRFQQKLNIQRFKAADPKTGY